jgi:hypothetical protein
MIISKKRNFIFIHIYKTAGTSIAKALLPFAVSPWLWEYATTRIALKLGFSLPIDTVPGRGSVVQASEMIASMGKETFDSYFSFAIARNPWDWHVSLYKHVLRDKGHHQHKVVKAFNNFDEYIEWRCLVQNEACQRDFIYSQDNELLVDFLGRFENLEADFAKICDHIGISTTIALPKLNVAKNRKPYQEYYNEKTKELVRQAFKEDIELLGYDFESS